MSTVVNEIANLTQLRGVLKEHVIVLDIRDYLVNHSEGFLHALFSWCGELFQRIQERDRRDSRIRFLRRRLVLWEGSEKLLNSFVDSLHFLKIFVSRRFRFEIPFIG